MEFTDFPCAEGRSDGVSAYVCTRIDLLLTSMGKDVVVEFVSSSISTVCLIATLIPLANHSAQQVLGLEILPQG